LEEKQNEANFELFKKVSLKLGKAIKKTFLKHQKKSQEGKKLYKFHSN
jgi:hypothetical protein